MSKGSKEMREWAVWITAGRAFQTEETGPTAGELLAFSLNHKEACAAGEQWKRWRVQGHGWEVQIM